MEFGEIDLTEEPEPSPGPVADSAPLSEPVASRPGAREEAVGTGLLLDARGEVAPRTSGALSPGNPEPELLDHSYRPLLDHLAAECRRVVASAESDAETLRASAEEESRRIVNGAHRERSVVLRQAADKQASMYQEAEAEIERWLSELEEERDAVLGAARSEADRMLRAVATETQERANARLDAAEEEARRIVEAARLEAERSHRAATAAVEAPSSAPAAPPVPTQPVATWLREHQPVAEETLPDEPLPPPAETTSRPERRRHRFGRPKP